MKRIAILAAAALLGAATYANAETVLSGAEMDRVNAGLFGLAITQGLAQSAGDIDAISNTFSDSAVDLTGAIFATPTAVSTTTSAAAAAGFLGAVAQSAAASTAALGN
jgi:hypothetical protein